MSKTKKTLSVGKKSYTYYSLKEAKKNGLSDIDRLPKSMKVLLENLLRHEDGQTVTWDDVLAVNEWAKTMKSNREISYYPARVVMQDFTGVPAVVDLAAMREAMVKLGGDAERINPLTPVDLVIDHSVMVDFFGDNSAFKKNVDLEYERNKERYTFLKWGQKAFQNFRVVPPGTGIIHQVNVENLAQVVWSKTQGGETVVYPDTCVGTDSHTTMVNGLSVLGWGVGGIEAEAAMLGQPVTMLIPEVVGVKLTGKLKEGMTATDLVLTVTQMLRKHGVVDKFVEFFGPGVAELSLADRTTLANMAPEYGATCGFFPIDHKTVEYLRLTGRSEETANLVEAYAKEQGFWFEENEADPVFTSTLSLDLSQIVPSLAGPSRPQDRVELANAANEFGQALTSVYKISETSRKEEYDVEGADYKLKHGHVVLAAITSCTNTSNPSVLIAAGLLARKACELGLKTKPWVKTSLAPGSQVVTDYLVESGLQQYLDKLGFNLVGYGCTTCIGNSGPLPAPISKTINAKGLAVAAVLSGNRNFEGRISPDIKANYLASPPLCVAYALAGSLFVDITRDSLGKGRDGKDVFLKDIWPSNKEINETILKHVSSEMYRSRYANVFDGDDNWKGVKTSSGRTYEWEPNSTYIRRPPYFDQMDKKLVQDFKVENARVLALLGDSVTTDHISPAGDIKASSAAGKYLESHGVAKADFNSYGARRGNHEVMMRGTFGNIRIKNEIFPGREGSVSKHFPTGEEGSIYDVSMKYQKENTPLVIIAGKEYGTGSSRDWAAKGTNLLGVKAVVAESFERIHRSNLIGMGVMPMVFESGVTRKTLGLVGDEVVSLNPVGKLAPKMKIEGTFKKTDGSIVKAVLNCRIDTEVELEYFQNGGILQYVLKRLKS